MAGHSTTASLSGKYDKLTQLKEEFAKIREELRGFIEAAGGKLLLQVNVPTLRVRGANGARRLIQGRMVDEDGTVKNKIHEITPEALDSPNFSPGLALDIIEYLKIEKHNATAKPGDVLRHNQVLLNDGQTRVNLFDVGSEEFFQKKVLQEHMSHQSLYDKPVANMTKMDGPMPDSVKHAIAAKVEAARLQSEIEEASVT